MITREQVLREVSNGKIFSAKFIKKDQTTRVMSCRLGVVKNITGKGHSFDPAEKGLLNVYDMNKRAYRFINLNTTEEIHANGKVIK